MKQTGAAVSFEFQTLRREFEQLVHHNLLAMNCAILHSAQDPEGSSNFFKIDSEVLTRLSRTVFDQRHAIASVKRLLFIPSSELQIRAAYSNAIEDNQPSNFHSGGSLHASQVRIRASYLNLVSMIGRLDVALAAQLLHISTDLVEKIRENSWNDNYRMAHHDISFTSQPIERALNAMLNNMRVDCDDISVMAHGLMIAKRPSIPGVAQARLPITTASNQAECVVLAVRLIDSGMAAKKAIQLANCSGKIKNQLELSYRGSKATRSAKSLRPIYKSPVKHAVSSFFLVSYMDALAMHLPGSPKIQPDAFSRALTLTQCAFANSDKLILNNIFTAQQALNIAEHYHADEVTCQNCKACGSQYMKETGAESLRQNCPGCILLGGREVYGGRARTGRRSFTSVVAANDFSIPSAPTAHSDAAVGATRR